MPITLRTAVPEDEAFLYRLYADTRAEELAAWGWDDAQQRMFLQLQFRGRQSHYAKYPNTDHRIVLEETQPIGRLFLSRLEKEVWLVDIALLHEYRGRGIGEKLIQELLDEAAQSGKAVRLHVEKFNRAQRLYQRLGFVVVGDEQTHYLMEWKSPTVED